MEENEEARKEEQENVWLSYFAMQDEGDDTKAFRVRAETNGREEVKSKRSEVLGEGRRAGERRWEGGKAACRHHKRGGSVAESWLKPYYRLCQAAAGSRSSKRQDRASSAWEKKTQAASRRVRKQAQTRQYAIHSS